MAGTNVVITSTVNKVTFDVDGGSYARALKKIRNLKGEWEKTGQTLAKSKTSPSASFISAQQQMKLVNKRLEETRRREAKKTSDYQMALDKKRATSAERASAISNARIRQTVGQLTSQSPESAKMRKFYQDMEKQAKRDPNANWKSTRPYVKGNGGLQPPPMGGAGSGSSTIGAKNWDQYLADIRQRAAALNRPPRVEIDPKVEAARAKAAAQARAKATAQANRRQDIIGQQDIRLRSKHGADYGNRLGGGSNGIKQLNKDFAAGRISVGNYRASIASLERQFRSAQSSTLSFGQGLSNLRSSLMGITAAYGAFNTGKSILEAGQFFQGLEASMTMISDSGDEAGKRIAFVRNQSYRLGLDLKIAAQGYTQMAVAAQGVISKSDNDNLFKGYSEYATALQVDPVKYQRGIVALGQMLGKGQIQSQELKQQLAEGIPGSMQAFVRAAQKYFKDDKIGVPELFKLMEEGKLLAKDILPLVGDEFRKAANKGGALDLALLSNRVAMQRLGQTFFYWKAKVFNAEFGQAMTDVFNDLAHILDVNGGLAAGIGEFFAGVVEGAWDMATRLYNTFTFISRVVSHFLEGLGVQSETMKQIFDWTAYGAGALIFIGLISRIFNLLSKIVGLRAGLSQVFKLFGGSAAASETAALGAGAGAVAKFGVGSALKAGALGYLGYGATQQLLPAQMGLANATGGQWNIGSWLLGMQTQSYMRLAGNGKGSPLDNLGAGVNNGLMGKGYSQNDQDLSYLLTQGTMAPFNAGNGWQDNRPQQAEITVRIDAGELQKIVDVAVDNSSFRTINLLAQGGNP